MGLNWVDKIEPFDGAKTSPFPAGLLESAAYD